VGQGRIREVLFQPTESLAQRSTSDRLRVLLTAVGTESTHSRARTGQTDIDGEEDMAERAMRGMEEQRVIMRVRERDEGCSLLVRRRYICAIINHLSPQAPLFALAPVCRLHCVTVFNDFSKYL
jgi:hypothetical protein